LAAYNWDQNAVSTVTSEDVELMSISKTHTAMWHQSDMMSDNIKDYHKNFQNIDAISPRWQEMSDGWLIANSDRN
jgi:predicted small metal-binding protein